MAYVLSYVISRMHYNKDMEFDDECAIDPREISHENDHKMINIRKNKRYTEHVLNIMITALSITTFIFKGNYN